MIFTLFMFLYILKEYITRFGVINGECYVSWCKNVLPFCKWSLGWKQYVKDSSNRNDYKYKKRIVILSNHQNMIDFVHLQYFVSNNFPEHIPVFVINNRYSSVPLYGRYVDKFTIPIHGDITKDSITIERKINELKDKKVVIILFPEGKIYEKENIDKSNSWCKKQNIENYTNVLCPRTKGLYTIINKFKPDVMLQSYLTYSDDIHHEKGKQYTDFINGNLPRIANLDIRKINMDTFKLNTIEEFTNTFYAYWRGVDTILIETYEKYKKIHTSFLENKYILHDYMIPYNQITWVSSKYNLVFIPFAFWVHGFWYGILALSLLFTSYQYHVLKKWLWVDVSVALTTACVSLYLSKHTITRIFLLYGLLMYGLHKSFKYLFNIREKDASYFLHSSLHAIGSSHILVEFLMNSLV